MGISFKVSNTGKRFHPKPSPPGAATSAAEEEESNDAVTSAPKKKSDAISFSTRKQEDASETKSISEISDNEVSFTLSLFPDGYSIAKPMENESVHQISTDIPKLLHPYDRTSETVFSAIESGRLPGDILNDIPCKYINGTLVCEVRDYRKCSSDGLLVASGESSPIINRVCLRMSLENIVKDIPTISDNGWTYGDLMEVESRILKALQPQLYLDPTPQLDKLSDNLIPTKLNLALRSMRRKKLSQIPEVTLSSDNKKVCLDRVQESSRLGDSGSLVQQPAYENLNIQNNVSNSMLPLRNSGIGSDGSFLASPSVSHQLKYPTGVASPKLIKDQRSGALLNAPVASPGGQNIMIPFTDNGASSIHGKRENQDGQSSPLTNKKPRFMHTGADGNLQQHFGQQIDNLHGSELHWKNTSMQQPSIGRGVQHANNSMQKFPQQVTEGGSNQEGGSMPFTVGQQGIRYNLKEEPVETERLDSRMGMGESELTSTDPQSRLQQRVPPQFRRSSFPQTPWNNLGQPLDNNSKKEDSLQKRKLVQSPRTSAGGLPQSPLSSKSGEFSSGSIGHQFGAVSGLVSCQKEKSAVTSVPSVGVGGNPSFTSSANDSMLRQNQAQATPAKGRLSSLPKTPAMSGIDSPASVSNVSVPINANGPPVGSQPLGDQTVLERFSKIEMVSMSCQLNSKKNKVEENSIRKHGGFSPQQLVSHLSSDPSNENLKDEMCKMPLSKSLVGGTMNACKTRILNFVQTERIIQGNSLQYVPKARTRMIMSEKPNDGAVAFHIGEIDDADYLAAEDYLPTLPNTYIADLLAAQFCSLMAHEGYHVEDHLQPKPVPASIGQHSTPGITPGSAISNMQQHTEGGPLQSSGDIAKPGASGNAPVNSLQNAQGPRMLPPGNIQTAQMSQGLMPGLSMPSRPQQPEQLPTLQQQPQQQQQRHPQFQRSPMMLPANSMQHLNSIAQNANAQLGVHMTNKPSIQLQMLQQQQLQQQQQQPQQPTMQRKMMPALGTVGMGNINSNMVGLGGLGNVTGIGGARAVGGTGISAPMGPISGMGNINQNSMNLSSASNIGHAIRSGALTPAQALMKLKMANRSSILGNAQSGMGGMPGARQMHPGSMLGSALNRASINPMQRTAMGQMGPPKLMPGFNLYMNQQQHQQQQAHLQQQQPQMQLQQQQLQQQQIQQQQETTSPLQAVVSPQQVGSPSSVGIPHQTNQPQQQQASPQPISQRTPLSPQLSSGPIHPMTAGNPEACPASPQLSSQTLGSVGSITNSPMELQGVNKSNSVNNA